MHGKGGDGRVYPVIWEVRSVSTGTVLGVVRDGGYGLS